MQSLRLGRAIAHASRAAVQPRWNSAAPPANQQAGGQAPSEELAGKERETKSGSMNGAAMIGLGISAGLFLVWGKWMTSMTEGEQKLRKMAAERRENPQARADPLLLRRNIMSRLQFVDPQASSEIVQLGIQLAVYGPSDDLKNHPQYAVLQQLKDESGAMSWADLGAYVAYIALEEMGAPTAMLAPKFGRSPSETARRAHALKKFPGQNATYAEYKEFGDQFGLTETELVALVGGQNADSILFGTSREPLLTTNLYRTPSPTGPYGALLTHDEFTRKACYVFSDDQLYFNLYFASALDKVLSAGWAGLTVLPDRLYNTTNDQTWASRQKRMYGVAQEYVGADSNYNQR